MKLHELKANEGARHNKKRVGRGAASGHGKTAGRGENGQNKRSGGGVRPGFEGGQNPWYRRLPKRGFTNVNHVEYQVVNLDTLNDSFGAGDKITIQMMLDKRIISKKTMPVKLLGSGKISISINIEANAASKTAIEAIENAGGKVEIVK